MIGWYMKIMIGCISSRCLAESHIVAGLRFSIHAHDPGFCESKCFKETCEVTGLSRSTALQLRKFNDRCPCRRLGLESWKSAHRKIYSVTPNTSSGPDRRSLSVTRARASESAEVLGASKIVQGRTRVNCRLSTALTRSLPLSRGQTSLFGERPDLHRRIPAAAMEASYGPNAEPQSPTSKDATTSTSLPGIICPPVKTVGKSTNILWQECMVRKEERQKLLGQKGCVIWITGLSGSGKSTLACTLDHALLNRGNLGYVLDGDNVRHGLNNNLGFSAEDRAENIRRVGEVAKLFVDAGIICIASVISPYRKDRDACRQLLQAEEFIEVYMNFPLNLCEERDPKGLYKLARAGKIKGFTGVDDPYEAPLNCEVVMEPIDGKCPTPTEMAAYLVSYLEHRGFLGPPS